jgi:hypothetical protein
LYALIKGKYKQGGHKMKVIESKDYNKDFPESFNWGLIDSIKLSDLGNLLSAHVRHDLKNPIQKRYLTAGLRLSLNLIAEQAEIN